MVAQFQFSLFVDTGGSGEVRIERTSCDEEFHRSVVVYENYTAVVLSIFATHSLELCIILHC